MSQDTVWCDNAFFQLTANMLKRDIVFYTLYKEDGHDSKGRIIIKAKQSFGKMFLLYYTGIHFQSIVAKQTSPLSSIALKEIKDQASTEM